VEKPSRLDPQTLLRLVRIETRLEDLVIGKASRSASAPTPDPIQPVPAQKTPPKASRGHDSPRFVKTEEKVGFSKRQFPLMMLRLFGPDLNIP